MREGLGKMNSETPKPRQMTCHRAAAIATSSSQGAQRSSLSLALHCAIATVAFGVSGLRIAPMCPRSSSTMSVNSLV